MAQPTYGREDVLMEQFRAIAQRYEINDYFAGKLKQLEGSATRRSLRQPSRLVG